MADEHMVEQMSRSRGNRSGRRSFRGATPPPSPKLEVTTNNQKINTSDEKDTSIAVFEPLTEDSLVVEEQQEVLVLSEEESNTNSHNVENKEVITSRKRPPSPSLIIPIATKKSLSDGISEEVVGVEDESKLNSKLLGNKPSGVTTNTGSFQHTQVPIRSPSMPPPKLESSASKVLTEELQKQLGQENSKLKSLIIKEVRRPGKSESCVCVQLNYLHVSMHIDDLSRFLYQPISLKPTINLLKFCDHFIYQNFSFSVI